MCGIICIYNKSINTNSINTNSINLDLLQEINNRGQESYGISYFINNKIILNNFIGKLPYTINESSLIDYTNNTIKYIIGHTRYSTSGIKNIHFQTQPLEGITTINNISVPYILVHNGNISNRKSLKKLFNCDISNKYTDSQILVAIINNLSKESWEELLKYIMDTIPCVYNLIIGTNNKVYIMRDRYGIRPLCFVKNDNSYCILSESNEIEKKNYKLIRDIEPGEIAMLDNSGLNTIANFYNNNKNTNNNNTNNIIKINKNTNTNNFSPCLFEYIYFCNKNSVCDNVNITQFRYSCGRLLAKFDINKFLGINKKNTIVVGAPETGITAGIGYADLLNINYHQVLEKTDKGRTFILDSSKRQKECKIKYSVNEKIVKFKNIIIIDDSLVRGNTLKVLVKQLKDAKASSIHIRIASPPVISPCYYGIDIPTYEELIAHKFSNDIEKINEYLGSNSLKYLEVKHLIGLLPKKNQNSCVSCFTNNYDTKMLEW